ncbi:MAG: hypothetical protein LBK68_00920 [Candidatus Margulisbacteria bacterium]|nr:hypothetical protein [Candidatus Margulisiibacteriota bacterium]
MANAGNYTDTDFKGTSYNIDTGKNLSAEGMRAALHTKEKVANKQICSATTGDTADTLTNASSSDSYYPSSKLVGKNLDALNTALSTMNTTISTGLSEVNTSLNGKQDKIGAGTAKNIVAYSGTAGTFDTLTRAATIMETDTTKASDDKIPTEKAVATALGDKLVASDLTTLDTKVTTLETTVSGLQRLLPVGTILMFNAAGWQDNITMVGWYRCIAANVGQGVPDLSSRFILGSTTHGQTGGSNALTAAMLPKHTHTIYTNATKNTARTADRTLAGEFDSGMHIPNPSGIVSSQGNRSAESSGSSNGHRIKVDAAHEHTGTTNDTTGYQTDANTSNMPAYYTVIYIMRVR